MRLLLCDWIDSLLIYWLLFHWLNSPRARRNVNEILNLSRGNTKCNKHSIKFFHVHIAIKSNFRINDGGEKREKKVRRRTKKSQIGSDVILKFIIQIIARFVKLPSFGFRGIKYYPLCMQDWHETLSRPDRTNLDNDYVNFKSVEQCVCTIEDFISFFSFLKSLKTTWGFWIWC